MPYFQINGVDILPSSTTCPVEFTAQSTNCNSSGSTIDLNDSKKTFFATKNDGTGGQVVLNGVTDSGYKLVTADNATYFDLLKNQDVFNSKLKITHNGTEIIQKYCKKGYAPTGSHFYNLFVKGSQHLVRYPDGTINLQNTDGSAATTLCTSKNKKCVITFVLVAGGGGGGGGGGGWAGSGCGGGGGGGSAAVVTIIFPENVTDTITLLLVTGGGGSGGASDKAGSSGGSSYIKLISPVEKLLVECYGGGGGGDAKWLNEHGDYGRAGTVGTTYTGIITNSNGNNLLHVYTLCSQNGEPGRKGNNPGPKNEISGTSHCNNYTVTSNWLTHIGGRPKTGGGTTTSLFDPEGGSPGNTPVSHYYADITVATNYVEWFGDSEGYGFNYGCGGWGGGDGKSGDSGKHGAMRLFY